MLRRVVEGWLPVGPRSVLFGAHQFLLHPIFVAVAWWRHRGFPWDPRLWVAFFLHDIGYLVGWCPEMDGPVGAQHPAWAGHVMDRLFGKQWGDFCRGHSRTFAKQAGIPTSALMPADKLATALYPPRLYVALCWLSGEWVEYRDRWVASGTYPDRSDDGVIAWAGYLQANWARFRDKSATAGHAYGGE